MTGLTRGQRVRSILRLAQPSVGRFVPGLIWGVLSAAAAVSLLAVSGWLIVSASIVDSLVPLSIAVVGVRFFAVSRAVTRYLERLSGHDAALRQLASTRADMVRRLIPLSPAGLGSTDRGQVLTALVDDVENLQNLPLRVVQPLGVAALVAVGAVGFIAFVSPPAALTLAVCLLVAAAVAIGLGWVFGSRAEALVSARRAELSAALVDYFASLDVLLAYGAEEQARARITAADGEAASARLPRIAGAGRRCRGGLCGRRSGVGVGARRRGARPRRRGDRRAVVGRGGAGADGGVRDLRRRADRCGVVAECPIECGAHRRRAARPDAAGAAFRRG